MTDLFTVTARLDLHRAERTGFPEVIYAPGKTPAGCVELVAGMLAADGPVLLSRADDADLAAVEDAVAVGDLPAPHEVHRRGAGAPGTVLWRPAPPRDTATVGILTAGTSDLSVAGECRTVLRACGVTAPVIADVGVAGLHRLLGVLEEVRSFDVLVVVAGMEGALASVVGGLVDRPVVAVPTSAGYGASLGGLTALLAMLSSCAPGVSVVGIDNGVGAAAAVLRIVDLAERMTR